ncbi:MAG: hypothetical protein EA362_14060 [Saprospirales bacterium]|nr:MAG: hypothetical protein EA362_14060 [Saprospirales bacterium]
MGGASRLITSPVAIFSLKIWEILEYEAIMRPKEDNYFVNKFSHRSLLGFYTSLKWFEMWEKAGLTTLFSLLG